MATTLKAQSKAPSTLFPLAPQSGDRRAEFSRSRLRRDSLCSRPVADNILPISAVEALRIPVMVSTGVGAAAGLEILKVAVGPQLGMAEESVSVPRPLRMAAVIDDDDQDDEDEDLEDEDDDLEDEDDLDDEEEDEDEDDLDDEDEEDDDYEDLDEDDEDEDEDEDDE